MSSQGELQPFVGSLGVVLEDTADDGGDDVCYSCGGRCCEPPVDFDYFTAGCFTNSYGPGMGGRMKGEEWEWVARSRGADVQRKWTRRV